MSENNKFWANLGSLRQRDTKAGKKENYLILSKEYKIVKVSTGEDVNLGDYRQIKLMDPKKRLETSLSNGKITEEKFNEDMAFLEKKNVRYDLVVPPQVKSEDGI